MKIMFDDKDLLKALCLQVGDIISCSNTVDAKFKIINTIDGIFFRDYNDKNDKPQRLHNLVGIEFEKVEQKIWDNSTYELGEDKAYFITSGVRVDWTRFYKGCYKNDYITDFDEILFFTKRKYAEDYLEELKKFNEEYKKNN